MNANENLPEVSKRTAGGVSGAVGGSMIAGPVGCLRRRHRRRTHRQRLGEGERGRSSALRRPFKKRPPRSI
ncbi:MAG: hypothetical protein JNL18_10145 [Planctomycetaceae bacterium]|nr:hypothetical protein [Planctomycetaceae bacterium]